ncbi:ribosomal biogenesis protein LAS1L [Biomphalaria glabrata]
MAAPLMSLLSPGTIKHVVPWRTRSEFVNLYNDLYSDDLVLQERAINRIAVWKSRASSKLSVAIESSGMLMQACLEHSKAEKEGTVHLQESHLRYIYSLALIRFVNHVTEKGQTKATAQPVHLIAREFGIPEWIVRLRHDATHASIPCLDALSTGAQWALNYLKENFWKLQTKEDTPDDKEHTSKMPRMSDIRRAFYDFQKCRFEEVKSGNKDKETGDQSDSLKVLHKYLNQNRLRFVKCLLEDGILISTEEQLTALGVSSEDLLTRSPPTVPLEMAVFWRPLLKKLNSAGALHFLLNIGIFSVTSGEGLRNYQLVAWIAYILSQCLGPSKRLKRRRTKKQKKESIFKSPVILPTKTLLNGCLQNINKLTAHLLKYVGDKESLGAEGYSKLIKLLNMHTHLGDATSSDGSDSDTVYTVEDIKKAKVSQSCQISTKTALDIQSSLNQNDIPWSLCTDIVDWLNIPLGVVPDPTTCNVDDDEDTNDEDTPDEPANVDDDQSSTHSSDNMDDDYVGSRRKSKKRSSDSKDGSDVSYSPKRSRLVLDGETLI